jgi:hypothetical protein
MKVKQIALAAAALAVLAASPALAEPGDIFCAVGPPERGQFWLFYPTSIARSGSVVGEVSEVKYADSTHEEKYDYGQMPVWTVLADPDGGVTFVSKSTPGWSITVTEPGTEPWNGIATLRHDGRVVDDGFCSGSGPDP